MKRRCPHCARATYYPRRTGDFREPIPAGYLSAATKDGACTTCWRVNHKSVSEREGVPGRALGYQYRMDDEEIWRVRAGLTRLADARRARGIPPEGADPATLERPGLTLLEA